jgi:hypothetical protein
LMQRMKDEARQQGAAEIGGAEGEGEAEAEFPADERGEEEKPGATGKPSESALDFAARQRIEELFEEARKDRSRGMRLKAELDRLGCFKLYENRFLDLFKRAG